MILFGHVTVPEDDRTRLTCVFCHSLCDQIVSCRVLHNEPLNVKAGVPVSQKGDEQLNRCHRMKNTYRQRGSQWQCDTRHIPCATHLPVPLLRCLILGCGVVRFFRAGGFVVDECGYLFKLQVVLRLTRR